MNIIIWRLAYYVPIAKYYTVVVYVTGLCVLVYGVKPQSIKFIV